MILIDAEKLKLAIRDDPEIDGQNFARMKKHIEEAPTVEVVHARWNHKQTNSIFTWHLECSNCGADYHISDRYNYCPNCGAKMDGEV